MAYAKNIPQNKSDPWFYFVQPLHRFDALWYEEIAKHNYTIHPDDTAFFPLYPWFIQSNALLLHVSYPVAALIVNTILTAVVFFLLYLFTFRNYGQTIAKKTLILYAVFPATFFLLTPYAEPLLFTFVLLALLFAQKGKPLFSVISASFAAMTKPYAVGLILPLFFIYIKYKNRNLKLFSILLLLLVLISFLTIIQFQSHMTHGVSALHNGYAKWGFKIPPPWEPFLSQILIFIYAPFNLSNTINFFVNIFTMTYLITQFRKAKVED